MKPAAMPDRWDQLIQRFPGAHVLQSAEWAGVKSRYGWSPIPLTWPEGSPSPTAAALVLERSVKVGPITLPLRVLYVPRGPLLAWADRSCRHAVLDRLQQLAVKRRAVFIKIDPEVILGTGLPGDGEEDSLGSEIQAELENRGWIFSQDQIQFRNSMWIDLNQAEDTILAGMKAKTRYNLHLAEKKGVTVRSGSLEDLGLLYQMYAETSVRDHFVIREEGYYHEVWSRFLQAGMAEILIAEVDAEPVAALVQFRFARRAWYLYGMSRAVHREKMPNVLLQWHAIRRAKAAGCTVYDLWGAPDEFNEQDSMWGVYRFKEGLGARVVRTLGAWDYPTSSLFYRLYCQVLPRVTDFMRMGGLRAAQHRVQPT